MKITKAIIKAAEPRAERYWIWDELVPGLGMIVLPSGIKSWVLRYRTQAGKQRTHTLGRCLEIHPDQAREVALELLRQSRTGEDPTLARRMRRSTATFDALRAEFERLHYPLCKAGTVANYKGYWANHILPRFGQMRVDELTAAGVREMRLDYLERPITFNRVREMLAVALDLAIEKGWRQDNPARGRKMRDFTERKRKRYLTAAEAPRLGAALTAYGERSEIRWRFAALITLLLVTGCRVNEIARARWDWIDWDNRRIVWPDTKTGADEGVLSEKALELLTELQHRIPGNPWVIAGARLDRPLSGYGRMWKEVCQAAGIVDLRVHDLRKSFASVALAEGFGLDVIAMLLRHSDPSVTASRYAFLMEETRRSAVSRTAQASVARLRS
jgi:integrase